MEQSKCKNTNHFTREHNGWRLEVNQYHFHWFDGDQLPGDISEFVKKSGTIL